MKTIKTIGILSIFAILLMNCTGEKGAIGPQGIAGKQGAKGEKGDAGVSGVFPKTQTGTFTIKAVDWLGNSTYRAVIPVTAITKEVIDKGIISVWWVSTPTQQLPLPYDRNTEKISSSYYATNGGQIRIDIIPSTNITSIAKPSIDMTFRWVINQ